MPWAEAGLIPANSRTASKTMPAATFRIVVAAHVIESRHSEKTDVSTMQVLTVVRSSEIWPSSDHKQLVGQFVAFQRAGRKKCGKYATTLYVSGHQPIRRSPSFDSRDQRRDGTIPNACNDLVIDSGIGDDLN